MFLGIEIGGTKLQLGVGAGDGKLVALERFDVVTKRGAAGILEQIRTAGSELVARHGVSRVGFGFGGGKLRTLAHSALHVPLDDMGMVESVHLCVFHWVLNDVFARINSEGRYAKSN